MKLFFEVIGDPVVFASHLRHAIIFNHLFDLLGRENLSTYARMLFLPLARSCLVHFHLICDHYNIEQCGALDFTLLIKQVTDPLNPNNPLSTPLPLSHFNDDEIHFLTTTLPNAFKSSPMYPGELNKGIIFPLMFTPLQSAAFTQHYTQLLSSSDESAPKSSSSSSSSLSSSSSSSSLSSSSTSSTSQSLVSASRLTAIRSFAPSTKQVQKVPTINIPFSIFVYLALLNTLIYESKRVLFLNMKVSRDQSLYCFFFHIPNVMPDLYPLTLFAQWNLTRRFNGLKTTSWTRALQMIYFMFHQTVHFPILQNDPLASLKSRNSFDIMNQIVASLKSSVFKSFNVSSCPPPLYLTASLFGLQLSHFVILMIWSQQFNSYHASDHKNQQILKNIGEMSSNKPSTVSFFRLQSQRSPYSLMKAPISTQSNFVPTSNSISSNLQTNNSTFIGSLNFRSILSLIMRILYSTSTIMPEILSHLHPSFFLMILSIIIHRKFTDSSLLDRFKRVLFRCLSYDLDPQLYYTIRSIVILFLEYRHVDFADCDWSNDELFVSLQPSPINQTLSHNVILSSNTLPCINHTLSSVFYGQSIYQQDYNFEHQTRTTALQSDITSLLNHNTNSTALSNEYAAMVEQMIQSNNSHAVYRQRFENVPATYPSAIPFAKWLFSATPIAPSFVRLSQSPHHPHASLLGKLDRVLCSFFYFFRNLAISLMSNNLHYINLTQDVLNSINKLSTQTDQRAISQHNDHHSSLFISSSLHQLPTTTILPMNVEHCTATLFNDITMASFSHQSTLLGLDSQLCCIPYMAIQHNFSRTLFHLVTLHDWTGSDDEWKPFSNNSFLHHDHFIPTLLYFHFLHTFICKPIAVIQIEKEINLTSSFAVKKSIPINLFQKLTYPTQFVYYKLRKLIKKNTKKFTICHQNKFRKIVHHFIRKNYSIAFTNYKSIRNALKLWNCGIPSSTSSSTSPSPFSLSDQHQLHTLSGPSLITYSSVNTDTLTTSSSFTFDKFYQTPHYQSNLYKHAHLPPAVIKQLYCIYTEALIFTIQAFAYASFTTPLLNDATKLHTTSKQQTADVGISTLSPPGCTFKWRNGYIPLGKMDNLKTALRWDQLTDFGGTIQRATEPFQCDKNGKPFSQCVTVVQSDSYHQHIMDLYNNSQQVQYSFKPERHKKTSLQRDAKTTVPDYILDQRRTRTIAIAYEWSSAMAQHSIELFIELLLNEGSWEFVSQIDFSDDKQPLAEEYVIDYIPRDRADWGVKDKWTSNVPPNCTDKDTTFPLYKQFIPTQYQAQIPTLATGAMCPSHPDRLPHSIYHPNNTKLEQNDALMRYYDQNTSLVPAFVFTNETEIQDGQLQNLGFKTPTRGHLPYFYNLSTDEQHELYQTFSFANLTSNCSPSPSFSTPSTTTANKPSSLDIDLAEYFNQVNNDIPLNFENELVRNLKTVYPVYDDDVPLQFSHQSQLRNQDQYLTEYYSAAVVHPTSTITFQEISDIFTAPSFSDEDITDIFTTPSLSDEDITPNTRFHYSSLPSSSLTTPQLLPATFTIPTSLLVAQIQTQQTDCEYLFK